MSTFNQWVCYTSLFLSLATFVPSAAAHTEADGCNTAQLQQMASLLEAVQECTRGNLPEIDQRIASIEGAIQNGDTLARVSAFRTAQEVITPINPVIKECAAQKITDNPHIKWLRINAANCTIEAAPPEPHVATGPSRSR